MQPRNIDAHEVSFANAAVNLDSVTCEHEDDRGRSYRAWKSWTPERFGACSRADAAYFRAEMRRSGVRVGSGTTILEIGFGNGAFAAWVTDTGATYIGTELDRELVARGRDHGYEAFDASRPPAAVAGSRRIDCVVAFDVLEHLGMDEIRAVLRSAAACLADGGTVIARVPSGDSPFSRVIQYGDLTHRSVIGSGMVPLLAAGTGLEVVQVRPPVLPMLGLGLRRLVRRVLVASMRAMVAAFIRTVYHDAQPTVLTPNMLIVLRKPGSASRS